MSEVPWNCPLCTRPALLTADATYQYCAACEGYTAAEPPPGHGWVEFTGGELDGCYRLVELRLQQVGDEWSPEGLPPGYRWDGTTWVYIGG
jgi:hypothetical protein